MPLRLDFFLNLFLIKSTFHLRAGVVVLIAIILLASPIDFFHSKNPAALVFPLSVLTQCGVCGFHDGCSRPLSPGD